MIGTVVLTPAEGMVGAETAEGIRLFLVALPLFLFATGFSRWFCSYKNARRASALLAQEGL